MITLSSIQTSGGQEPRAQRGQEDLFLEIGSKPILSKNLPLSKIF